MNLSKKLTKKLGPFPVWVWGIIGGGGALIAYKLYSSHSSSSSTAATDGGDYYDAQGNLYDSNGNLIQAADNTSSDSYDSSPPTIGGNSGGGGTYTDPTSVPGGGSAYSMDGGSLGQSPTIDESGYAAADAAYATLGTYASNALGQLALQPAAIAGATTVATTPDGTTTPASLSGATFSDPGNTSPAVIAKTPAVKNAITSSTILANGATLTTYSNGREVEQAPGKSAYTVKAGGVATQIPPVQPSQAAVVNPKITKAVSSGVIAAAKKVATGAVNTKGATTVGSQVAGGAAKKAPVSVTAARAAATPKKTVATHTVAKVTSKKPLF